MSGITPQPYSSLAEPKRSQFLGPISTAQPNHFTLGPRRWVEANATSLIEGTNGGAPRCKYLFFSVFSVLLCLHALKPCTARKFGQIMRDVDEIRAVASIFSTEA